jgi:hypothetical protein
MSGLTLESSLFIEGTGKNYSISASKGGSTDNGLRPLMVF